jgi:hypothetical protein
VKVLFLTSPDLLDSGWASVADLIRPVVDQAAKGEFSLTDLERMCRDGRAYAGLVMGDAGPVLGIVFEFRHYPQRMNAHVIAVGGSELEAAAVTFWPTFREWCKESGATEIEAWTSPAMTRMLARLGFMKAYDVVRMPC